MPMYEYLCSDCNERSEVIQSFKERPLRKCPLCGGRVKKLVSAPAIQFKGSGFYITDYADKKTAKAGETKGKSETSASSKDSKDSKDSKEPKTSSSSEGSASKAPSTAKGKARKKPSSKN